MALHRGIQSAIFYYLSCAPCAEARSRKQRKQEAALGRADREALEAEMPNLYRHPSPSSTNPYWGTEIAAGPVLSSRGRRKGAYAQTNESQRRLKSSTTQRSDGSDHPASLDFGVRLNSQEITRDGEGKRDDSAWPMMPSFERLPSRGTTFSASTYSSGGGITRPPRAMTKDSDSTSSYKTFSNPRVNDLVPAIATQIHSKEEALALMQSPPDAEYMSGRDGNWTRNRSDSGGSSGLSMRSAGIPLSREVSRRMIERKLQNGEMMSRQSSERTTTDTNSQKLDRMPVETKDFAHMEDIISNPEGTKSTQLQSQHSTNSSLSAAPAIQEPLLAPQPAHRTPARKIASRPQLSTIVSSDNFAHRDRNSMYLSAPSPNGSGFTGYRNHSDSALPTRNYKPQSPTSPSHNDLTVLIDDRKAADSVLDTHTFTFPNPDMDVTVSRPSVDIHDELYGPAIFDSWQTPDFALPEWVHEHTKREVKKRWSMDF